MKSHVNEEGNTELAKLITFVALLQFTALYWFKSLEYLALIVTHGYIQTAKGSSFIEKRFMENWINWFGDAGISVNIKTSWLKSRGRRDLAGEKIKKSLREDVEVVCVWALLQISCCTFHKIIDSVLHGFLLMRENSHTAEMNDGWKAWNPLK